MKFTLSWLKEHLETKASLEDLLHHLTMLGIEVESCEDPSEQLATFVIAEIRSLEKHPDADRLNVCQVQVEQDASKPLVQVVCGAPNVYEGMKTVFAPVGTYVPGLDITLKQGNIRGVDSCGMMCSKSELNLGEDSEGIVDLPSSALVGTSFAKAYGYDDPVIEVGITPNRGDCFGVRGIAQDLAAKGLGQLKPLSKLSISEVGASEKKVRIEATKDCPVYMGRMIRDLRNQESPEWLQQRLRNIGLDPISAVVDVTNYINYDLCRPLHAFDADRLRGDVSVRKAKAEEAFVGLNDEEYTLSEDHLVIADQNGPVAVAGVLGGKESGTSMETTSVFLESALFAPEAVMKAGRELNIHTDSRTRFERGIDPESVRRGLDRATQMILDICGGEASEIVVEGVVPSNCKQVTVSVERVYQLTGIRLDMSVMQGYLESLGFTEVQEELAGVLKVMTPSWRHDISEEHDVVEEILRLHGYDALPNTTLDADPKLGVYTFKQSTPPKAKRVLAGLGFDESIHYSFIDRAMAETFSANEHVIEIDNPISQQLSCMRPSLMPGLLQSVQRNIAYSVADLQIFEVGNVYQVLKEQPVQECIAAAVLTGNKEDKNWNTLASAYDVFDMKRMVCAVLAELGFSVSSLQLDPEGAPAWYHPGQSAALKLGPKNTLGYLGRIHPATEKLVDIEQPVFGFEIFLDRLPIKPIKPKSLKDNPLQPVHREFAFFVGEEVPAGKLMKAVETADKKLISDVAILDVYAGKGVPEGKKSVALNVKLSPQDKTLDDDQLQEVSSKIVAAVEKSTGGELRGTL